jgi:flagellar biosynthesis/type III secretory pathway chaperone
LIEPSTCSYALPNLKFLIPNPQFLIPNMSTTWETELSNLLNDLLSLQSDLLNLLTRKRDLLVAADAIGLSAIVPEEEALIRRLEQWLAGREQLLNRAADDGLPKASLRALTAKLPKAQREALDERVRQANSRCRLLRHHSLTNWVVIQRTLIHLSQMLEIIATGGRLQPTYGGGGSVHASGSLVDRAA